VPVPVVVKVFMVPCVLIVLIVLMVFSDNILLVAIPFAG
jgi:hypothetical protein